MAACNVLPMRVNLAPARGLPPSLHTLGLATMETVSVAPDAEPVKIRLPSGYTDKVCTLKKFKGTPLHCIYDDDDEETTAGSPAKSDAASGRSSKRSTSPNSHCLEPEAFSAEVSPLNLQNALFGVSDNGLGASYTTGPRTVLVHLPAKCTQRMFIEELKDAAFAPGRDFTEFAFQVRNGTNLCYVSFSNAALARSFSAAFDGRFCQLVGDVFHVPCAQCC